MRRHRLVGLEPFWRAQVLEQCRAVMSTGFNCLREGAVEAVGGMPWHSTVILEEDLVGLKAACSSARSVPRSLLTQGPRKLLAKHVECKLPLPHFHNRRECMVVDV